MAFIFYLSKMIAYGFHFLSFKNDRLWLSFSYIFKIDRLRLSTSSPFSKLSITFAGVPGLEPRLTEPESAGLPITPYPIKAFAQMR